MPSAPIEIRAPLAGSVVALPVAAGEHVAAGGVVVVVESMKMEHEVHAGDAGIVVALRARVGDVVAQGEVLALIESIAAPSADTGAGVAAAALLAPLRADLLELQAR